jgi:hypothetical protein
LMARIGKTFIRAVFGRNSLILPYFVSEYFGSKLAL